MNNEKLLRQAKKEFYNGSLISEEVKNNFEIKTNILFEYTTNPQNLRTCYGNTIINGQFRGNLDSKSKQLMKDKKKGKADILVMRNNGSGMYNFYFVGGFYRFNPHRISPDNIFAIKQTI